MSASRAAKVWAFRQTLPDAESDLVICEPNCKIFHDHGKWAGAAAPPEIEISTGPIQFWKLCNLGNWDGKTITGKMLEKHARTHGPEEVQGVADALALKVNLEGIKSPSDAFKAKRRVKRVVSRRDRAQQLLDLGHSWRTIEDTLDLTRPVSMRLQAELGA